MTPSSLLVAATVLAVATAGCATQVAAPATSASLSPTPSTAGSSQPSTPAGGATASPTGASLCVQVDALNPSQLVGEPMLPVQGSSTETICTYLAAQASKPFDVIVRLEDTFEDIAAVRAVFPDGETASIGDGAYWAPGVTTMWFNDGGRLYAVQIVGVDDVARSMGLASTVATAVSARLR